MLALQPSLDTGPNCLGECADRLAINFTAGILTLALRGQRRRQTSSRGEGAETIGDVDACPPKATVRDPLSGRPPVHGFTQSAVHREFSLDDAEPAGPGSSRWCRGIDQLAPGPD